VPNVADEAREPHAARSTGADVMRSWMLAGAYHAPMRLTAVISDEGDWFAAQCLEVDVASQGHSVEEARENLAEALTLYFDDHDVEVGDSPMIVPIDVVV
jgi:predicted RNase H-like HicB family nuclease